MIRNTLIAFGFLTALSVQAQAATVYDLTASSTSPATVGGFTLSFEDFDNDSVFSLDELVAGTFSGIDFFFASVFLDIIIGAPVIVGISDGTDPNNIWRFTNPSNTTTGSSPWTQFEYQISISLSAVPLPATLPLLAAGFGALGLMRRRKRKAAA